MKTTITALILFVYLLYGYGQELSNYNDWKIDTSVLNNHYNGGTYSFIKDHAQKIEYPYEAEKLCSQAVVLFEFKVLKDTIIFQFNNNSELGYEESIIKAFNQNRQNWRNANNKVFKLSIGFKFDGGDTPNSGINKDSVMFMITLSRNVNDLIYHTDDLYKECLFKSNDFLLNKYRDYKSRNEEDSVNIFRQELIRRDPLMHHINNHR
tara:strand:- start:273 stop:896 length:624 start_codon:yes stop_codon:yes gene_type:complete